MARRAAIEFDEGVLSEQPVCEFGAFGAVERLGGHAVLPWRGTWLAAREAGLEASADSECLPSGCFEQCLVHLQKGRAGSERDLAEAWRLLAPGGRLLLAGPNALGIVSCVKRLASELEQSHRILTNRAHARVVLFHRDRGPGPTRPPETRVQLPEGHGVAHSLCAEPGVFSARKLDAGSAAVLARLAAEKPARRLLDLGCGIGPLGLGALLLWPRACALLLDADARAVRSAGRNARALGLEQRCEVLWWDAQREACPERGFDLVLSNPPFHSGTSVDLSIAGALFEHSSQALGARGRALIVANRTLPYETRLAGLGRLQVLDAGRGYKLLRLQASRSAPHRPAR